MPQLNVVMLAAGVLAGYVSFGIVLQIYGVCCCTLGYGRTRMLAQVCAVVLQLEAVVPVCVRFGYEKQFLTIKEKQKIRVFFVIIHPIRVFVDFAMVRLPDLSQAHTLIVFLAQVDVPCPVLPVPSLIIGSPRAAIAKPGDVVKPTPFNLHYETREIRKLEQDGCMHRESLEPW